MTTLANEALATGQSRLPPARGTLSAALLDTLPRGCAERAPVLPGPAGADPFGDDLHLALQLCYELHYRGLPGVSDSWEWNPALLRFRAGLEEVFLAALRSRAPLLAPRPLG